MLIKSEFKDVHEECNKSSKCPQNITTENNEVTCPEFVNIKCEIDVRDLSSVKEEPHTDHEVSFRENFVSTHSISQDMPQNISIHEYSKFTSSLLCKEESSTTQVTSDKNNVKEFKITITPVTHVISTNQSYIQECAMCHQRTPFITGEFKHQGNISFDKPVNTPILCNICTVFESKHYRTCEKTLPVEKIYCCDICKRSFNCKSTIIRHMHIHNNNKPYSCKVCKKKFACKGLIKPHMRVHTGEKPYSCPLCTKLFSHKHNMQRHKQRHEKVKQLKCPVCNKKFPMESRLKYHMRIHTNEKHFKCGVCKRLFSHKQNVLRHYSRKHPHEKYSCPDTDASVARIVWENVINKKVELLPN